ncbi:hypothetical protein GQ457_05G014590 [Hibiscus cannabinus]
MVSEAISPGSMAEPSSTVVGSSSSKPFTNKTISIRLDESNYLLWRQQVLSAIESLALESHVDGTKATPPQYVAVNGVRSVNPDFVAFKQQDSALCSWLLSSISPAILPSLVSCRTTVEIWDKSMSLLLLLSHLVNSRISLMVSVVCFLTHKLDSKKCIRCYYRFDQSYDGFYSANFVEESVGVHDSVGVQGSETDNSIALQDYSGTVALVSEDFSHVVCEDMSWFPDSGATAHLTPDAGMVRNSFPYVGPGRISVANGESVSISRVGDASLKSNSRSLVLNNLLHVPSIKKNLLSISQFTRDNHISIEFYPDSCVMKDLQTRQEMLRGVQSSGLYKLPSSQWVHNDSAASGSDLHKSVLQDDVVSKNCCFVSSLLDKHKLNMVHDRSVLDVGFKAPSEAMTSEQFVAPKLWNRAALQGSSSCSAQGFPPTVSTRGVSSADGVSEADPAVPVAEIQQPVTDSTVPVAEVQHPIQQTNPTIQQPVQQTSPATIVADQIVPSVDQHFIPAAVPSADQHFVPAAVPSAVQHSIPSAVPPIPLVYYRKRPVSSHSVPATDVQVVQLNLQNCQGGSVTLPRCQDVTTEGFQSLQQSPQSCQDISGGLQTQDVIAQSGCENLECVSNLQGSTGSSSTASSQTSSSSSSRGAFAKIVCKKRRENEDEEPPHILVIHLKRFKYIEQLSRYKKLSYRVVFPLELKLSNTVEDADLEYSLFAVVVHVPRALC